MRPGRGVSAALILTGALVIAGATFMASGPSFVAGGRTRVHDGSGAARGLSLPEVLPGVDTIAVQMPALVAVREPVLAAAPGAVATLSIPRLGIRDAPIFDRGLDAGRNMAIAPGYAITRFAHSASFGTGNTVLYGHDDIEGSVFERLQELQAGDSVDVTLPSGFLQHYRVQGRQIVPPTALAILAATPEVKLTVFTCWPNHIDTARVVVTAVPA